MSLEVTYCSAAACAEHGKSSQGQDPRQASTSVCAAPLFFFLFFFFRTALLNASIPPTFPLPFNRVQVCVAHLHSSAGTLPRQHVFLRSAVGAMATMNLARKYSDVSVPPGIRDARGMTEGSALAGTRFRFFKTSARLPGRREGETNCLSFCASDWQCGDGEEALAWMHDPVRQSVCQDRALQVDKQTHTYFHHQPAVTKTSVFMFPLLTAGGDANSTLGRTDGLMDDFVVVPEGDSSDEVELGGAFEADAENGDFIGSRRQNSFEERR